MLRKIVQIDEEKCNGCGLCIGGCHEGALKLINGKAKLVSDSYCDGLGACLPDCPTGAISIVDREAAGFDEEAVKSHLARQGKTLHTPPAGGCPGSMARMIARKAGDNQPSVSPAGSELRQWPCQLKLVPVNAPYFDEAHLLVAADCAAYACADMHAKFMRNKITLIGCPKLDEVNYAEKLADILKLHEIKSLTVVRMEVSCCGGLVNAVKEAIIKSGKMIPWSVAVIGTDGNIRED
ncbi:ferredoxin [Sporomusaceae bacterium BoRhaA]|uniref:ATP-binding protein n=1 Tax=Pelorhabdus rhamnosifermentans TaxID=2772457 RepID=UPI001C063652|nr:4Fe-4S binding protein [Pelorhabdus rhamnosifermentans]MBU2701778.1 ferredoxin [Pelorhabdus rhamnosifermentans]